MSEPLARRGFAFWLVAWLATIGHADAAQQSESPARDRRLGPVTATVERIDLDGVLSEPIWRTAPNIGDLIQRQPNPGTAPTERTGVVLLYDEHNLYIGISAHDSEPQRVIGTQMRRDASLNSDDRVEILLDTFRDQSSAFYFSTNPAGALIDGLVFANGQLNTEWDAIWDVRTSRTEEGWTAEFSIPFKSLSFPSGQNVWGFNVARTIARKLEDARWSGARLETQFLQVSEAGQITNLEQLTQGVGLDVRPFVAGRWLHSAVGDEEVRGKPGLDLFYSITPSLRLTATFNTDFGETEVDARQINLTRFSLLFPEKRAFFLEGAGVFSFAGTIPEAPGGIPAAGADVYPFFSRQIGLLGGQEVPLIGGVKLTGTVGRTDVGLLTVRTNDLEVGARTITDEKTFLVTRIKQNLFQQSYVGAIFTAGDPALGQSGQTYGADLRLATSRLLGASRNLIVNAFGVRSVNEGVSDRDWSYGVSAHYPNDKFIAQVSLRDIQGNFAPDIGFVQRNNVRVFRAGGSYNPRPRDLLNIQQFNHDVFYTRFTRLDNNEVESWDVYVTWLDWHFKSGDNIHGVLDFNPIYERLFEPFQISPGVVLPPGEYRFTRFKTNLISTATKRRLSGSANVTWGNYWSGKAEQITTSLTFKLPPQFTISISTNQTFARLTEGHFIARIFTTDFNYSASPRLSFSNLLQFDNRSRNLGWQSRMRWTLRPGSDVFVAFNQGWISEVDQRGSQRFRALDSKLSGKFQYSYRF
jgi:hypothetical protein